MADGVGIPLEVGVHVLIEVALTTRAALSVKFECRMTSTKSRPYRGFVYL